METETGRPEWLKYVELEKRTEGETEGPGRGSEHWTHDGRDMAEDVFPERRTVVDMWEAHHVCIFGCGVSYI